MIWTTIPDLNVLNQQSANTATSQLGIELTAYGDDYLVATMPVDHRTKQPFGLLHGGASVLLAETVGSAAANLCLEPGNIAVGVDINANHLRAVAGGVVTATAKPVNLGRSIHVWQINIEDERAKLICTSRLTMAVRKAPDTTQG